MNVKVDEMKKTQKKAIERIKRLESFENDNEIIKCQHIVMIVKKAFENVTSLIEVNNAKMVYSCIQQSLNRDKIFNEKERYEILQFVSTVIFDFSHKNTDIKIECLTLCHNLVKDILTEKAKINFMKYQMNMLHEIDTKTQEIVNPYFGLKGVIFD